MYIYIYIYYIYVYIYIHNMEPSILGFYILSFAYSTAWKLVDVSFTWGGAVGFTMSVITHIRPISHINHTLMSSNF